MALGTNVWSFLCDCFSSIQLFDFWIFYVRNVESCVELTNGQLKSVTGKHMPCISCNLCMSCFQSECLTECVDIASVNFWLIKSSNSWYLCVCVCVYVYV